MQYSVENKIPVDYIVSTSGFKKVEVKGVYKILVEEPSLKMEDTNGNLLFSCTYFEYLRAKFD